jgi:hypothetical protein
MCLLHVNLNMERRKMAKLAFDDSDLNLIYRALSESINRRHDAISRLFSEIVESGDSQWRKEKIVRNTSEAVLMEKLKERISAS